MSSLAWQSSKAIAISGDITVPGDKSISHRSLIFGSQAVGRTTISGLLESEDVINTAKALQALGVNIRKNSKGQYEVDGVGTGGLLEAAQVLDLGNSGTGVRLLMGLVGSHPFPTIFTGDSSLCKRPMGRVLEPLKKMGISANAREGNLLPLTMLGTRHPNPIRYEMEVASAQVKSAILLAALNVVGETTVIEKEPTRDHTEKMLKFFGADILVNKNEITLKGHSELKARDIVVPADPSSAAFFVVAALLVEGSNLTIRNLCFNPHRTGLFITLKEMGADIKVINERVEAGENIADIVVRHSKLKGVTVPAERAPSMIDEYPILSVAASFATGKTVMKGLKELMVKESNRLLAIAEGLKANGIKAEVDKDNLTVHGSNAVKGAGLVATHMDHRIAMSFLVMGMASQNPVMVDDVRMIDTSFPEFLGLAKTLGGKLQEHAE